MSETDGLLTADNPPASGENWKDSVAKEVRFSADGNDKLARFENPGSLAMSYLEMEKMASGKVKLPTDASAPEDVSAFYQKLGRPDSAEGYTLPQLAEGQVFDEAFLGEMRTVAHEAGVTDKQFGGLLAKYIGIQAQTQEAQLAADNAEAETTTQALQKEWVGDYDKNLEISKRALRELVPDEMKDQLVGLMTEKNLDNNVLFIKFLHSVGAKTLDDSYVKGDKIPEKKDDYQPKYINSPEQYRNDETEEGAKARTWFTTNKGFVY